MELLHANQLDPVRCNSDRKAADRLSRKRSLFLVVSVAIAIAAMGSHLVVYLLGIRTGGVGYKLLGREGGEPLAFAEGSSLMVEGLGWDRISRELGVGIENWFVAGSSPSEWEALQPRARNASTTFIVVSAYDLNEEFLCDSRSEIVPLSQTIKDLWRSRADWHFAKRVLSQYPLKYVRILFPTVGRSDGVMVGVREKLAGLLKPWMAIEPETGPTVRSGDGLEPVRVDKVSDWTPSRLLRRFALMKSACQGKQNFDGLKKLAFLRMLKQAHQQGRVIVIVLPVSPLYTREFLPPVVAAKFEATLTDAQQSVPEASWVHLEELSDLNSNDCFWDLVHLNAGGQRIATDAVLSQLRVLSSLK